MAYKRYNSFAPKSCQDKFPTWSVTNIDSFGTAECLSHFTSNNEAIALLDTRYEMEPNRFKYARVLHHYGPCVYCGEKAHA